MGRSITARRHPLWVQGHCESLRGRHWRPGPRVAHRVVALAPHTLQHLLVCKVVGAAALQGVVNAIRIHLWQSHVAMLRCDAPLRRL